MKTSLLLSVIIAAASLSAKSCDNAKPMETAEQTVVSSDSLVVKPLSAALQDSTGNYGLNIAWPEKNKSYSLVANAISEWMSEQLGGTYEGSLQDGDSLLHHYFNATLDRNKERYHEFIGDIGGNLDDFRPTFFDSISITKDSEGANWVTFNYMNEVYLGGAHGSHIVMGQTFRKSDGRRIGWELFKDRDLDPFQKLIKDGLKEYFEVKTDDQLAEFLQNDASIYHIPMPQCPPLFTEKGVLFVYNQYEIAAYAAGLPSFEVEYAKLLPFLNVTGKRLIKE